MNIYLRGMRVGVIRDCDIRLLFVPFIPRGITPTPRKCGLMVGGICFVMLSCCCRWRRGWLGPYPQTWILWTSPLLMTAKNCSLPTLACPTMILLKGGPFTVDGCWVMVVWDEVGGSDYWGWLWLWCGGWGGGFFRVGGVYPLLVLMCSL